MITYNQLISYVRPFFLSRGWDDLASSERMLFYANTSIQDIYNADNATFTYKEETITWVVNWNNMTFTTKFWIRKVQKAYGLTSSGSREELTPTIFFQATCENAIKFTTWEKDLVTNSKYITLEVIYVKEYVWKTMEDLTDNIQLPDRYIWAVCKFMYDWAAPINLMAWEAINTDFFSHWMNRVNSLKDDDYLTDYPEIHPAY